MKIAFVISILLLIISCNGLDRSSSTEDSDMAKHTSIIEPIKDTTTASDYLKLELSDKATTITVFYAAIECGCPQWAETKFKDVKFFEGVETFYLEPLNKDLKIADDLWDGTHLPLILKVTGRFSKQKAMPLNYPTKGTAEKARFFWYDKIKAVSPQSN